MCLKTPPAHSVLSLQATAQPLFLRFLCIFFTIVIFLIFYSTTRTTRRGFIIFIIVIYRRWLSPRSWRFLIIVFVRYLAPTARRGFIIVLILLYGRGTRTGFRRRFVFLFIIINSLFAATDSITEENFIIQIFF